MSTIRKLGSRAIRVTIMALLVGGACFRVTCRAVAAVATSCMLGMSKVQIDWESDPQKLISAMKSIEAANIKLKGRIEEVAGAAGKSNREHSEGLADMAAGYVKAGAAMVSAHEILKLYNEDLEKQNELNKEAAEFQKQKAASRGADGCCTSAYVGRRAGRFRQGGQRYPPRHGRQRRVGRSSVRGLARPGPYASAAAGRRSDRCATQSQR